MKKYQFVAVSLFSLMLLASCNTAEEPQTESKPAKDNITVSTVNKDNVEKDQQKQPEVKDNTSITYTSNGKQETVETTPVNSDQQNYSIQVIPGFTLTAEEPGKDLLFYEEDDTISMRIETHSKSESTFDTLVTNTKEMMSAIQEDYKPLDLSQYKNNEIVNSAAFVAELENEKVVGIVFEKENLLIRLTIFDNNTKDLTDAMIRMGLTIK